MVNGLSGYIKNILNLCCECCSKYRVTQKKYPCLIKCKMHNKGVIFKIEACLNYQYANVNANILALIFYCHLAGI